MLGQDPDSSSAAFYFATTWNYFITFSIVVSILQGGHSPMLSATAEGLIQIGVEAQLRSLLVRIMRGCKWFFCRAGSHCWFPAYLPSVLQLATRCCPLSALLSSCSARR